MDINDQRDFSEENFWRAEMEREAMEELAAERESCVRLMPWDYYEDGSLNCDIDCTCLFCIPGF